MTKQEKIRTARLFLLHEFIRDHFTKSDWIKIGYLTDSLEMIEEHPRLLRSLDFEDDDYEGNSLQVLSKLINESNNNLIEIERFVEAKKLNPIKPVREFISTVQTRIPERVITFAPDVFRIPEKSVETNVLSVMMPFEGKFSGTYAAIRSVCAKLRIECRRADDIWDNSILIQDVFDLIFTSRAVITDFTDRNPNVFYETGVAHTLGKLVIPITQSVSDIPFDLRHHRALTYLPNAEGLLKLEADLEKKLVKVFN
jgi:AbiJ N-terminal domain 5